MVDLKTVMELLVENWLLIGITVGVMALVSYPQMNSSWRRYIDDRLTTRERGGVEGEGEYAKLSKKQKKKIILLLKKKLAEAEEKVAEEKEKRLAMAMEHLHKLSAEQLLELVKEIGS